MNRIENMILIGRKHLDTVIFTYAQLSANIAPIIVEGSPEVVQSWQNSETKCYQVASRNLNAA